ncbi:MAG: carboxylase [Deltaproteobacteria bacterium]|nr:MAG: carboxylase [Deltaproteobacteria bacterium]
MAKQTDRKKSRRPLGIMDTTLRDGHQSLLATRLRTEDMLPICEKLDQAGFAAMEVWGGATFDATTRFLAEDPWERLATLRRALPNTKLQMLLRGQNLVGYRHYADDVVEAFVEKAAETGIDVFRVFDALNDERNMETSFRAIKKTGKHIQGAICFSLTEQRMGGPIYNVDYYVGKARTLADMGADSLCIKDMAGMLAPLDAYELVRAIKEAVDLPLQLHTHYTSGMGSMTYLKAAEAGIDIVDCALSPLALRTSQPAVEPLIVALAGTERDPGIALEPLLECGAHLEKIGPKYKHLLNTTRMASIDAGVLAHQIPGGMMSNLINQLREAKALDRLDEVLEELPRTRVDLGYPPLVTPSSQIVGTQAVMNVLFGRYERVTEPVKDYVAGLYGRPPGNVDPEVQKRCLEGYKYSEPISCRPADLLEPELDKAREAIKDLSDDPRDVLTYALYPTTGLKFLRWKHGVEEPPPEVKPRTLADVAREDELVEKARKGLLVEPPSKQAPPKSPAARTFNVFVDGEYFQVDVDPAGGAAVAAPAPSATMAATPATPAPAASPPPQASPAPAAPAAADGAAVVAPMPGVIIEYRVSVGDEVSPGQVLLILEAMKMQNEICADRAGTVRSIPHAAGDEVDKDEPLVVLG